ncbi:hypothetical protein SK3146_03571 [Paenibacillus konkukensis]|uniref:Copper amine oxidase-like N-terminal domain-containing protein n=1 Tax=Paenibacillus konkukensis TaxID=2020716 RepID=A0ABY4RQT7_9BACL|nr:copper amine oxidase N-terminal domain-containing protein [Paenibacillus konkukensis]UQZ84325.1 hypothetical protein SK3146_03571 [Paenibacillus konkukensis]
MSKKWKLLSLSSALLVGLVSPAYAEQTPTNIEVYYAPIKYVFDSEQFAPPAEQQGFIYEGSTYVPLRFISYSLNKAVRWDADTYTVTVEEPKAADLTEINEYNINTKLRTDTASEKVDASGLQPTELSAYKEKVNYIFDGKSKEIGEDLPGFIIQDSLYVPLRFFSEAVGKKIEWNPDTYTIAASKVEQPAKPQEPAAQEQTQSNAETPATTTPAVGGGSGGGGGSSSGGSSSGSTAAAQAKIESKLTALESSCRKALEPLADQYFDPSTDDDTRDQLKLQGLIKVAQCTTQFEGIMNEAKSAGISADQIEKYRARFEQTQEDAKNALIQKSHK